MSDPPRPDPSDRHPRSKRPLPHILPARTKLPDSGPSSQSQSQSHSQSQPQPQPESQPASSHSATAPSPSSNGLFPPVRPSPATPTHQPRPILSAPLPPRTQLTRVACEACRRRRTKCTGNRPRCAACIKNRSECIYSSRSSAETNSQALKRRFEETEEEKNVYKQLYESLHTLPEDQAVGIVRRIRMGASATSIVRQIQDGDLLLQMSLVPETRLRYDFPYRAAMPLAIKRSNNPYMGSLMYEAVYTESHLRQEGDAEDPYQRRQDELQELSKQYPPQYLRPYHAAKLVDSRLDAVDVTRWTRIISDNELLVAILSAYLMQEYPGLTVLHKDTFLRAMVDGDRRFCSPLLVNALMAEACHCYYAIPNRPRYWEPLNLGYRFLAEAKRLWELRTKPCTLVHAQAATLLHLVYCHNGLDQLGLSYLEQAVLMGHELGLFTPAVLVKDQDMSDARLFSAWAIFRWAVAVGFHFKRPSIMKAPPETPLPNPEEQPRFYGEFYLQYPLEDSLRAMDSGFFFQAWSLMRVIVNELASVAFSGDANSMPADTWLSFRQRLESWFTALPASLAPKNIVWPAQYAMHMEYHGVMIILSRMHISESAIDADAALVETAHEAAAETLPQAVVQFETVIRLYYLRHSFEYYDGYLAHFLSILVDIVMESRVDNTSDPEHARSTLVLCLKGLADQGRHVYIAGVIWKLLCDRQTPEHLNILGSYVALDMLDDRSTLGQRVYSAYPLAMGVTEDLDASRLENLTKGHDLEDQWYEEI